MVRKNDLRGKIIGTGKKSVEENVLQEKFSARINTLEVKFFSGKEHSEQNNPLLGKYFAKEEPSRGKYS